MSQIVNRLTFDLTLESGRVPKALLEKYGLLDSRIADVYSKTSPSCGIVLSIANALGYLDVLVEALPYFSRGRLDVGCTEGGWCVTCDGQTKALLAGLTLHILEQLLCIIALPPELMKDFPIDAGDDSRWVLLEFDALSNTVVLTSASENIFEMCIPRKVFVEEVLRLGVSFLDLMEALIHHPQIRQQDKQAAEDYKAFLSSRRDILLF